MRPLVHVRSANEPATFTIHGEVRPLVRVGVPALRECPWFAAGDDAPLAICDRTVDSDDASAVNVSVGSDGGASP